MLAVLAAPLLIDLYTTDWLPGSRKFEVAVLLARFILPQLAFFGIGAVAGAILDARDRYAAPMWAPVINNLVVICVLVLYMVVRQGGRRHRPGHQRPDRAVGLGTTAGIVAQAVVLIVALKRIGFSFVPRFDVRNARLGEMGRAGIWTIGYVVVTQLRLHADDQPVQRGGRRGARPRHQPVHPGLPALPAALRRHRRLGDHGHAAQDEPGGRSRATRRGPH